MGRINLGSIDRLWESDIYLRHNYLSTEFDVVTQQTGSVVTSSEFLVLCFIFTI